jgi:hypothetical protein
MTSLRDRTHNKDIFLSFSPTIILYVDFLHRLSQEATEDPAQNMQGRTVRRDLQAMERAGSWGIASQVENPGATARGC